MTGSRHSGYRFKLTLSSWKRSPRKYLAVERVLGSSSGASSVRSGHFLLSRRCESICSNQIGHKTCQFSFTFSSGLDNKVGLMPFRGTSKVPLLSPNHTYKKGKQKILHKICITLTLLSLRRRMLAEVVQAVSEEHKKSCV